MSNRSIPNLEERLKHASEARKSMLAKFEMSLVEGPAPSRNESSADHRRRESGARAQGEEARQRQERDRAKQAELAAQAAADAERAMAEQTARDAAEQANVMRCLRLNTRRLAMPVTRHGRQPRSDGGRLLARISAIKGFQATPPSHQCQIVPASLRAK